MTLLEALQLAKGMKRPIVYISNGYILGSDESFAILSSITLSEPITDLKRPICGKMTDIITPDKVESFSSKNPIMFFTYYEAIANGVYVDTFVEFTLKNRMLALHKKCNDLINESFVIQSFKDITKTMNGFTELSNVKSADGMQLYHQRIGDVIHYMSTFTSIHPVTKTDVLNLYLYDIDDRSFIAKFEVIKKKNLVITEYIRYRYI